MENTTEKKNPIAELIEKGKIAGKVTTQEIDTAMIESDLDMEELEKVYENLEALNIEIIDDFDLELDSADFDVSLPKGQEATETVDAAVAAIDEYPRAAPSADEWMRYDEQIEHSQEIIRALIDASPQPAPTPAPPPAAPTAR